MKTLKHFVITKAFLLWLLPFSSTLSSCHQSEKKADNNTIENLNSDTATVSPSLEVPSSAQEPANQEEMEPDDSVMAKGNHVIFFMKDGEWANEIGAEELATAFTEHALDAMDELEKKGYNTTFLIGEEIKIGRENQPVVRIDNTDCVMGVVLTANSLPHRTECGTKSSENFWRFFNEYYKPQL